MPFCIHLASSSIRSNFSSICVCMKSNNSHANELVLIIFFSLTHVLSCASKSTPTNRCAFSFFRSKDLTSFSRCKIRRYAFLSSLSLRLRALSSLSRCKFRRCSFVNLSSAKEISTVWPSGAGDAVFRVSLFSPSGAGDAILEDLFEKGDAEPPKDDVKSRFICCISPRRFASNPRALWDDRKRRPSAKKEKN